MAVLQPARQVALCRHRVDVAREDDELTALARRRHREQHFPVVPDVLEPQLPAHVRHRSRLVAAHRRDVDEREGPLGEPVRCAFVAHARILTA